MSDAQTATATEAAPQTTTETTPQTTNETATTTQVEAAAEKLDAKEVNSKNTIEPKLYKVKIDGEELELTEEELVKHAQLGKAAHKRMQESAALRKDVDALINLLKTNPAAVLSDPSIGVDIKKFAQDIINQEIEDMQKSPEQREKEKLTKELEGLRKAQKESEEKTKQVEFERLQEQAERQIDEEMTSALDGSGLPKKPYVIKKMAEVMMTALKNDVDLTAKDVVPLVRKQIVEDIREMLGASPESVIEELVGKEFLNNYRKKNIQKVKQIAESAKDVKSTGAESQKETVKKKISMKDFLNSKF